jgi:hypothetical protein
MYRVDTETAGETLPDMAGATILAEALQSFTRLVVTGAYDRVLVRDTGAGRVVAEWCRQGLPDEAPATVH